MRMPNLRGRGPWWRCSSRLAFTDEACVPRPRLQCLPRAPARPSPTFPTADGESTRPRFDPTPHPTDHPTLSAEAAAGLPRGRLHVAPRACVLPPCLRRQLRHRAGSDVYRDAPLESFESRGSCPVKRGLPIWAGRNLRCPLDDVELDAAVSQATEVRVISFERAVRPKPA